MFRFSGLLKKDTASSILVQNDNEKAVLLLHAFRTSPRMFSELAETLYTRGYSVYNMRLPGHGLQDESYIHCLKARDYLFYFDTILVDLLDRYNEVSLVGSSFGGTLCLELAKRYNAHICGVALLNPLIFFRQKYIFLTSLLKFFIKKIKKKNFSSSVYHDYFKNFYSFYPVSQLWEMYKVAKNVRKNLEPVMDKSLFLLSGKDTTISYKQHYHFLETFNSHIIVFKKSNHMSIVDREKDQVIKEIITWLER
jgi:carboxylesterase